MLAPIVRLQQWFERSCQGAGYTVDLLIRATMYLPKIGRKGKEVVHQTFLATFGSMPVVFITALFTGMILALQAGIELSRFGQEAIVGGLVAASMLREMGPVFTALPLAGLIGSTYAAEIGTMKVSEEIDALEVMSIDPVYYLVMPRIIALGIGCVVLTIYTNVIGILGGAIVARSILNVDFDTYLNAARDAVQLKDIYSGLLKAYIFGETIAVVACSQGLRAENGAEGVGKATLKSVIISFILILMFDYFLTWIIY
jgi:phospholipid/cholesterol/gamma-HCH transport system permease protein